MNSELSLADHITLELRADIIGGRLLPGMAEGDKRAAEDAMSLYLDDSEHLLLQMLTRSSHH